MRVIEDRQPLWPYILLSLLLHALLVSAFMQMSTPFQTVAEKKEMEVIPIFLRPEEEPKYRIADIEEPAVQKKPDKAKFLGMYDSSVREETVGIGQRPKKASVAQKPKGKERAEIRRKARAKGKDKIFTFDERIFGGGEGQGEADSAKLAGGALDDFYPDFKRGTRTYLNVLRHPDVEYFVRLKRAFKIAFNPSPALRSYFSQNRITRGSVDVVLGVSVDRLGDLSELFVFRSSGIPAYDREALRTVRSSAPFSSPPEKFVDDDGLLRMSWTFTVYM